MGVTFVLHLGAVISPSQLASQRNSPSQSTLALPGSTSQLP